MAWETGSATDHVDLFNKVRDFLTTNTDLVSAGENWTQVLGPTGVLVHGDQITLRGPGLTGSENIHFGMETTEDSGADAYNIRFWGHAAFSNTLAPREQALKSPNQHVLLWNQPLTYWIIANGRRWMLVAKVSTVYSSGYCGFIIPYASPSEYPYPMLVAGMTDDFLRWSTTNQRCRFFASPGYQTMSLYYPDNVWRDIGNYDTDTTSYEPQYGNEHSYTAGYVFPTRHYSDAPDLSGIEDESVTFNMVKCFDGSYLLRDLTVVSTGYDNKGPYSAMMGVMDGAYWIPGRENSSENIVTKDGVDHLVVQNLNRTGFRDYMALRLT
jgi:hypothetical protein